MRPFLAASTPTYGDPPWVHGEGGDVVCQVGTPADADRGCAAPVPVTEKRRDAFWSDFARESSLPEAEYPGITRGGGSGAAAPQRIRLTYP